MTWEEARAKPRTQHADWGEWHWEGRKVMPMEQVQVHDAREILGLVRRRCADDGKRKHPSWLLSNGKASSSAETSEMCSSIHLSSRQRESR